MRLDGSVAARNIGTGQQPFTLRLWDNDAWPNPDDLLDQRLETVYHPTTVWAGLLIPFSFGVSLFVDSDGYLAGLDGSSGETTAELFQEVSDPGGLSYPYSSSTSVSVL